MHVATEEENKDKKTVLQMNEMMKNSIRGGRVGIH